MYLKRRAATTRLIMDRMVTLGNPTREDNHTPLLYRVEGLLYSHFPSVLVHSGREACGAVEQETIP